MIDTEKAKARIERLNTWNRCEFFDDGSVKYYRDSELLETLRDVEREASEDAKLIFVERRKPASDSTPDGSDGTTN